MHEHIQSNIDRTEIQRKKVEMKNTDQKIETEGHKVTHIILIYHCLPENRQDDHKHHMERDHQQGRFASCHSYTDGSGMLPVDSTPLSLQSSPTKPVAQQELTVNSET